MGIYFKTARVMAENPDSKSTHRQEPVYFNTRGWDEFSHWLMNRAPEVTDLLIRFNGPVDNHPKHDRYQNRHGDPMSVAWTADECRRLYVALFQASQNGIERAYDFWEFTAMVCLGIAEDGLCAY